VGVCGVDSRVGSSVHWSGDWGAYVTPKPASSEQVGVIRTKIRELRAGDPQPGVKRQHSSVRVNVWLLAACECYGPFQRGSHVAVFCSRT